MFGVLAFSPKNISVIIKLIFPPMRIKLLFQVHSEKTFLFAHAIYFTCEMVTKIRVFSGSY